MQSILWILGSGRSGTTALSSILGAHSDTINLGEFARYFWKDALVDDAPTPNASSYSTDPIWIDIFQRIPFETKFNALRLSQSADTLFKALDYRINIDSWASYSHDIMSAYQAINSESLIIDSSKHPRCITLSEYMPNYRHFYLHCIRSCREVAHSWKRRSKLIPGTSESMATFSSREASARWVLWNSQIANVGLTKGDRYKALNWDEFCNDPYNKLTRIYDWLGLNDIDTTSTNKIFPIENSLVVRGNPDKFSDNKNISIRSTSYRSDASIWSSLAQFYFDKRISKRLDWL